jgi:hypothetical protein
MRVPRFIADDSAALRRRAGSGQTTVGNVQSGYGRRLATRTTHAMMM